MKTTNYTARLEVLARKIETLTAGRDQYLITGKANYAADATRKIGQCQAEMDAIKLERYERFGM
jgi:hypothetical protein